MNVGPRTARVAAVEAASRHARVTISGIATGGAGVGRLADGRVVFIDRTAPGDVVEVTVTSEHGRWTRGQLLEIVQPGPDRCAAPCVHYAHCGGCALQHMTPQAQLRAKATIVGDALRRIGGIDVGLPGIVASPLVFGYRNRVSFTLRRTRHGVIAGFHRVDRADRVLDIDADCLLPEPAIVPVWKRLRLSWGPRAELLPAGPQLRLTLRAGGQGHVMLLVEGGTDRGDPENLLGRVTGLSSIWYAPRAGAESLLVAGEARIPDRWGEDELGLEGAAFVQVNRGAAELLEAHIASLMGEVRGRRIIDAYCGIGLRARAAARGGATATGIDLDGRAVALARRAAPATAHFEQGRVEERLAGHLPADLVILNPPRAGVDAAVCRVLVNSPPARLIYVSCDPATLARDMTRLQSRFALRSVRCFDLFPQTASVETVAELACATS